jgi:uncharacterized protein YheU (UPF0270 family)
VDENVCSKELRTSCVKNLPEKILLRENPDKGKSVKLEQEKGRYKNCGMGGGTRKLRLVSCKPLESRAL